MHTLCRTDPNKPQNFTKRSTVNLLACCSVLRHPSSAFYVPHQPCMSCHIVILNMMFACCIANQYSSLPVEASFSLQSHSWLRLKRCKMKDASFLSSTPAPRSSMSPPGVEAQSPLIVTDHRSLCPQRRQPLTASAFKRRTFHHSVENTIKNTQTTGRPLRGAPLQV